MTLYGPLTAHDFQKLLERAATDSVDRSFFEAILDAVLDVFEAERGFFLRVREDGGVQAIVARNYEGQPISKPLNCISFHALRSALDSSKRSHHSNRAHLDRRYRTEEVGRGAKRPMSVIAFASDADAAIQTVVYLDHRFQEMAFDEHRRRLVEHWFALLQIGLSARDAQAEIRRLQTALEKKAAFAGLAIAPDGPGELSEAVLEPRELLGMRSRSPRMIEVFEMVPRLARANIPVLVCGETGCGKGRIAEAIHLSSSRRDRAFLSINCGSMPDALLESELFGHTRGAFTGADMDRDGLIIQADGGSLFLDEVGDMSPSMQTKLLRFLEDGRFRPLGSKTERRADVRLLSATRLELRDEVERGSFRADLYYRLCGVRIDVPPLRERREDIVGLAGAFLDSYATELGVEPTRLAEAAGRWLVRQPWPGNVRELGNVMRQVTALNYRVADVNVLRAVVGRGYGGAAASRLLRMDAVVASAEQRAIRDALGQSAGNKSRAAELLGITRKSLYRRLVKYGMIESGDGSSGNGAAGEEEE